MPLFVGDSEALIERELAPSVRHYVSLLSAASASLLAKCTNDTERAKLQMVLAQMKQTTYETVNGSMGVFETPGACVERLQQLEQELGVGRVIAWFNFGGMVSHGAVIRSMELFASRVMPHFSLSQAA